MDAAASAGVRNMGLSRPQLYGFGSLTHFFLRRSDSLYKVNVQILKKSHGS